ncbi:MAG: carboxymuconolactone decarboxylase family protein [Steroidobacteraceae bacterium]
MSRIPTPATVEEAPAASRPMLEAVKKHLGVAPNMHRLLANSSAALEGYLALSGALDKGMLPAPTRERIALAVAEFNGSNYCLSVHNYLGKNRAKLDDAEITANRDGRSNDPKADAAVKFAAKVARERGHISDADLRAVKAAGYDDAQVIEIIQHVALNDFTNFINLAAQTEIDFPLITARKAA